jgi:hypothetical protein
MNVNFGDTSPTRVDVRLASGVSAGGSGLVRFRLDAPDGPIIGDLALANTGGWQAWRTIPANIGGATGTHDLYVTFETGFPGEYVNINWFEFSPPVSAPGSTPVPTPEPAPEPAPAPSPTPSPPTPSTNSDGRFEAESADRQSGVTQEATSDNGGGVNLTHISDGDVLRFGAVDFGNRSPHRVDVRLASGVNLGSGLVRFRLDAPDGPIIGDLAIGNTGGWQAWRTVPAGVHGATGVHDLYVTFESGFPGDYANMNWFEFVSD